MEKQTINLKGKKVLITGVAGFIGAAVCERLIKEYGITIVGVDNLNDYYDVALKDHRLKKIFDLDTDKKFIFVKGDIADTAFIDDLFNKYGFSAVINLAAQAGVRYSIENPDVYVKSNVIGFYNILEACRKYPVEHLVYASSSSVYGDGSKIPYNVNDKTDSPVSLYAATKKSNELFAYAYSKLYDIPTTGLRFFTVYGPAGRPDMAYFSFAEKLRKGDKIKIFNFGKCKRDFTYIDDVAEGVIRVISRAPIKKKGADDLPIAPFSVYNIGKGCPDSLLDFVKTLSEELVQAGVLPSDYDFEAHKELVPMQAGDVAVTYADTTAFNEDFGFTPKITLKEGLKNFAQWYKAFTE